jgi:calcineurin-like phosphoesterase family protein
MAKIFFTSDTHFFHRNIIEYCPGRKVLGDTIEEMNDGLITNWNRLVGKDDIVYHLGDFTLTTRVELIDDILSRLNGRIRLIKGNHDKWLKKIDSLKYCDKFEWVRQYNKENLTVDGVNYEIVMMHYPLLTWDGSYRGAISVHGHAHGGNDHLNVGTKRRDVGVDAVGVCYHPIPLCSLVESLKEGKNLDHHDL